MQNLFTQLDKKIYGGFFHISFGLNVNDCDKKAAFTFQLLTAIALSLVKIC